MISYNPIVLDIEQYTSEIPEEKKRVSQRFSEMIKQHVFIALLGIPFNLM